MTGPLFLQQCSTARLGQRLIDEKLALRDFCDPAFTAMPGGEVVRVGGATVGGVGLSGLAPARDGEAALELARRLRIKACPSVCLPAWRSHEGGFLREKRFLPQEAPYFHSRNAR